jgi:hypothetical protein
MKEGKLMLHCGGEEVTKEKLALVPIPEETDSYKPVGHVPLVDKLITISRDLLTGFQLTKESYGLARDGKQLFGVLQFKNHHEDMGLAVGFRNSYDKSLTVGVTCGASVFVCDNLALSGEIVIMRKHTVQVWVDIEERVVFALKSAGGNYQQAIEDVEGLKQIPMDLDDGFRNLGLMYGRDLLGARQLAVATQDWIKPRHEEFAPRTAWSLYNCCTEALKGAAPQQIMEKHVELHRFFNPA